MICDDTCKEPGPAHALLSRILLEVEVSSAIHARKAHHFDSNIEVPVFSNRKRRRWPIVKRDTLARRYFFVDLDTDCSSGIILARAKLIFPLPRVEYLYLRSRSTCFDLFSTSPETSPSWLIFTFLRTTSSAVCAFAALPRNLRSAVPLS